MKKRTFIEKKKRALILNKELAKLFPNAKCALTYNTPFQLLVAVILSAQCTDKKVNEVTPYLFAKYPDVNSMAVATQKDVERLIYSTGFYRAKSKNIIATAQKIKEEFGGTVPRTMEHLITLSGVARKTANVVLGNCFNIIVGMAVDTHVIRLANMFSLTESKNPIIIEKELTAMLPQKEWFVFTNRMIQYGRTYCSAIRHDHENCPLTKILSGIDENFYALDRVNERSLS